MDSPADDVTRVSLAELVAARIEARRLGLRLGGPISAPRAGGHLSRLRGPGIEYDESRGYVPGDDRRTMDWRVTARTAKPHVKVHRDERERPVWLFVDQGPSMRFATRVAFKSVVAARAAALLGWMAVAHGDRVGGAIHDGSQLQLRPTASRERGLLPLLRLLAGGPDGPPAGAAERRRAPADFTAALHGVLARVRPGSLVFLLSDFAGCRAGDDAWLVRLTEHSEVMLIFIHDPIEAAAPPAGLWPVAGAAGGRVLLDLRSAGRRALYEARFARHRQRLRDLARRQRAHWLTLTTDEAPAAALARVFGRRAAAGTGA